MRYLLSKDFTKISETSGTIQNSSKIHTLEMSDTSEKNSGILINPLQKHTFSGTTIYLRCVDGAAEARVVSFIVDSGGGSSNSSSSSGFDSFDDSDVDDIFNP